MHNQIEQLHTDIDTLTNLLLEHDLAEATSSHTTGLTCDVHLYGNQVTRLTEIIEAGLLACSVADHPSNGTA